MYNPYAVYVNCDGAMDYGSKGMGGVGIVITFPDSVPLEPIQLSIGRYAGVNIERIELEGLIQAMRKTLEVFEEHQALLKNISHIIFITDRFGLSDSEKTSPFKIRSWRSSNWKNHEGKPIKNHKLLDELDKIRKKLSEKTYARVNVQFRPRKKNKAADKLAKTGKKEGLLSEKLTKKGEKIGRRKFDGAEIKYSILKVKAELQVHVFRKDPVQDEWEVWVEIAEGENKGNKLKIYTDDKLATKFQRGNEYFVRIKNVYRFHVHVFRTIKKIRKD